MGTAIVIALGAMFMGLPFLLHFIMQGLSRTDVYDVQRCARDDQRRGLADADVELEDPDNWWAC